MAKFSSRITKSNPGPPENLDKSVFTAENMREAQAIVDERISEVLPADTQLTAWEASRDSGPLLTMKRTGKDADGNRYIVTLLVIEP